MKVKIYTFYKMDYTLQQVMNLSKTEMDVLYSHHKCDMLLIDDLEYHINEGLIDLNEYYIRVV